MTAKLTNNVIHLPEFTPIARQRWQQIPENIQKLLLDNVYCGSCKGSVSISSYKGSIKNKMVVLDGLCKTCGARVARAIE